FVLETQMRVQAGIDYPEFIRRLLEGEVSSGAPDFGDEYEFGVYTNLDAMRKAIQQRDAQFVLSRMVAGFAGEWNSKKDVTSCDIEDDVLQLIWSSTAKVWISVENSVNEVGSIHTVQEYDLNFAGVIIGRDLIMDPDTGRIIFDRANYFDKKGMEN